MFSSASSSLSVSGPGVMVNLILLWPFVLFAASCALASGVGRPFVLLGTQNPPSSPWAMRLTLGALADCVGLLESAKRRIIQGWPARSTAGACPAVTFRGLLRHPRLRIVRQIRLANLLALGLLLAAFADVDLRSPRRRRVQRVRNVTVCDSGLVCYALQ